MLNLLTLNLLTLNLLTFCYNNWYEQYIVICMLSCVPGHFKYTGHCILVAGVLWFTPWSILPRFLGLIKVN